MVMSCGSWPESRVVIYYPSWKSEVEVEDVGECQYWKCEDCGGSLKATTLGD